MRIPLAVCMLFATLFGQPRPIDLAGQIQQEISRIGSELAQAVPADEQPGFQSALTRASDALRRGQASLAICELEPAWEAVHAWQFAKAQHDVKTPEAFADVWKRRGDPVPVPARRRLPAIVEAIAAAADARAAATYRASLPFSRDADLASGLFYLGSASAYVDYAAFVRQLAWPAVTENPPRFHSIASELDAFEKTVTSQYEQMERSQHPAYVRTSVMLKQARTLDERRQYAGALLEYLLARYRFGSIRPADSGAAVGMQLERSRATLRRDRDNSIARFFIGLASAGIAAGDAAGRAAAGAVVGDILPAYSSALKPAASRSRRATTAQTTITLVRWPFT